MNDPEDILWWTVWIW